MIDLKRFLKQNKVQKESTTYAATKTLTDEKGAPLLWKIKALTTKENDDIREFATIEIQITGKPHAFRSKLLMNKYIALQVVTAVEYPNLHDASLQDSYGVKNPEDLLKEMVDNPSEYNDLVSFVQEYSGFEITMQDKVDEVKN